MSLVNTLWDNVHEIIIEEIEFSRQKELDNIQEVSHREDDKR